MHNFGETSLYAINRLLEREGNEVKDTECESMDGGICCVGNGEREC